MNTYKKGGGGAWGVAFLGLGNPGINLGQSDTRRYTVPN